LVDAAVGFIEFFRSGGSECAVVVAAEGGCCEAAGGEEAEDFGEVVEEDIFIIGVVCTLLYWRG
jgi:hypothetical protein